LTAIVGTDLPPALDVTDNPFVALHGHLPVGQMEPVDERLAATVPAGTLIDALGIRLTHVGPGAARAVMTVGVVHLNQAGVAQAGAVLALADATAGWAAKTALGDGGRFVTLELNANLVRPGRPGDELEAIATPVHVGRSNQVLQVAVRYAVAGEQGTGAMVASFRCTEMVLR
jgi:uncharacterized protein (TIGR00369 family)